MATRLAITAEAFEGMTFEMPTELVRGELVTMNMPGMVHGVVCFRVASLLDEWARPISAGLVAVNNTGVATQRDPDTVRGADCLFIRTDRLPSGRVPEGLLTTPPDLAVEVMPPFDRWPDVLAKVGEYLTAGVSEVWVVDSRERSVQVFRHDQAPLNLDADAELTSEDVLPGFRVKVAEFFRDV